MKTIKIIKKCVLFLTKKTEIIYDNYVDSKYPQIINFKELN